MGAAFADFDHGATLNAYRAGEDIRHKERAGVSHLVALVLAGDAATLLDYDQLRRSGADAGFLPYVTDEMVAEALALAYLVEGEGYSGLDSHLA